MNCYYQISDEDLDLLEEIIPLQQPYKAGKPWKFAGAFYYATTVLTTIGKSTTTATTTTTMMMLKKPSEIFKTDYYQHYSLTSLAYMQSFYLPFRVYAIEKHDFFRKVQWFST